MAFCLLPSTANLRVRCLERREIDDEIKKLEHHAGNRFEPMARFLKASKQAKKVASEGTSEEQLDFFKKSVRTHNWCPAT